MKGSAFMRMLLLKCVIPLAILVAGCAKPAPSPVEFSSARIHLIEITPPSGATVDEHTVIRTKLRYEIEGFKPDPGRYRARIMFDSTTPNRLLWFSYKTDGKFPGESDITSQTGELQLNYPLGFTRKRQEDIAFPLRLRFVINETAEKDEFKRLLKSRIIAKTATITYTPTFSKKAEKDIGFSSPGESSLVIQNVGVKPTPVPAGSRFEILVDYTATDPTVREGKIPVSFHYAIYDGTQKLYEKGPIQVMSTNAKEMRRVFPVNASKKDGTYRIDVRLTYGGQTFSRTAPLQIGGEEVSIQKQEASLEILKMEADPTVVQPGAKFELVVSYMIRDPLEKSDRIPIQFNFNILKSGSVLFAAEPVDLQAKNGGEMSRTLTLTAAEDPGPYELEAVLKYKDKTVSKRTPLEIK
jgi:hypothetical protein